MDALAPVRSELRGFAGYRSARLEADAGEVWLNANESPWVPDGDPGLGLNRYPQPQPQPLVTALAALYGVAPQSVLVGRGSDEGIDLLVRACCRAREDAVLVSPPTFGMYAVSARVQDARVVEVPLRAHAGRGFAPDVEGILAAADPERATLVFACSPNNPTGTGWEPGEIARVAEALAGRALLVVDEAYAEFADAPSAATLLARHRNLVVLRTLSKAHALAGARIGAVLADPGLIAVLRSIMPPYPVPAPCVAAALNALHPQALARTRAQVATLREQREVLARALRALPGARAVLPSAANFLAVRFEDGPAAYRRLLVAGVVVRDIGRYPGLSGCLRITVGAPAENARLLAVLAAAGAPA